MENTYWMQESFFLLIVVWGAFLGPKQEHTGAKKTMLLSYLHTETKNWYADKNQTGQEKV